MTSRVLIVEDEKDIEDLLAYNLRREGYETFTAERGEDALEIARSKTPDVILLDLMLPGLSGLEVCRLLQSDPGTRRIPILMLTAKGSEADQVRGLELGACDYIPKPFSVKVVLARVKNALRRLGPSPAGSGSLRAGSLELDEEHHAVTDGKKKIQLTRLEFNILCFLMKHPGRVFSREKILDGAWKGGGLVVDRSVDAHIKSIRQKLGKNRGLIETVRGLGYRFAERIE